MCPEYEQNQVSLFCQGAWSPSTVDSLALYASIMSEIHEKILMQNVLMACEIYSIYSILYTVYKNVFWKHVWNDSRRCCVFQTQIGETWLDYMCLWHCFISLFPAFAVNVFVFLQQFFFLFAVRFICYKVFLLCFFLLFFFFPPLEDRNESLLVYTSL